MGDTHKAIAGRPRLSVLRTVFSIIKCFSMRSRVKEVIVAGANPESFESSIREISSNCSIKR